MSGAEDLLQATTLSVLLIGNERTTMREVEAMLDGKRAGSLCFQVGGHSSFRDCLEILPNLRSTVDAVVVVIPAPSASTSQKVQMLAQGCPVIVLGKTDDNRLAAELLGLGAQDYLLLPHLTERVLQRSVSYAVVRSVNLDRIAELNSELKTKEDELIRVQLQLIQSEKMESLGRMAAGVAHEVKNPLGMLRMGVDFYQQRRDPKDVASELVLRRMIEAIDRADCIVRDMVDFSRSTDLELNDEDLNVVLCKAITLTQHDLTRGKVVPTIDLAEPIPAVRIDRMKVEQVIVNLITNAVHAMPDGGILAVKTYWGKIGELVRDEGLRSIEKLRPGDRVVVAEIRDNGGGIPEQKLRKIFDPFFTTKATGKGTGLGLAVAKTIVELHRGLIHIENVKPSGVRVRLIFRAQETVKGEETKVLVRDQLA